MFFVITTKAATKRGFTKEGTIVPRKCASNDWCYLRMMVLRMMLLRMMLLRVMVLRVMVLRMMVLECHVRLVVESILDHARLSRHR